jgi:uncharacterized protein
MDSNTLELAIKNVMTLPGKKYFRWIWHGGEPTLMGIDFFKEAVSIQNRYLDDRKVINCIQTNATLLNGEYIDFFDKNKFTVSSSLDGPEEIHNLTRVYPNGKGSFKDAWKGIQLIKEKNKELEKSGKNYHIGKGVACVLSKSNIDRVFDIYSFFLENNIPITLNPLIDFFGKNSHTHGLGIDNNEYGVALIKLFETWFYEDDIGIEVRPFSYILKSFISNKPNICLFDNSCREQFISIDSIGNVYPCGRFGGIDDFLLGNIHEQSLIEIINSNKHFEMKNRKIENIDDCKTCEYGKLCNAGCMFNAYMRDASSLTKDYYCESYKFLFDHIKMALIKELKNSEVNYENY